MSQTISGLVTNNPASPANLTGAAALETTDKNGNTVGVIYNQLRTALAVGGTGYAADSWHGDLTGNAATATKLVTARAINGVPFDGTAAITVPATAGTLSGTALASGIVSSSLASFGALAASLLLSVDNAYDLGDATHKFRSLFLSGAANIASDIVWTNNTGFGLLGNDGVRFLSYTTAGLILGSAAAKVQVSADFSISNGATIFSVRKSDGLAQFSGGLFALVDNAYDIGAASSNRPRNVYVAGGVFAAGGVDSRDTISIEKDGTGLQCSPITNGGSTLLAFTNAFGGVVGRVGFLGSTASGGHLYIVNDASGTIRISLATGAGLVPDTDNINPLGAASTRWTAVYAVNGTIQTSLKEAKDLEAAQPTDDDVLSAIRGAEIGAFTYKGDHGYNEHGHRHRHFSPMHHSLPSWAQTTDSGLNALTIAGLGLKGVQLLERRVAALEAKLAA